jgi:hypothetical protein
VKKVKCAGQCASDERRKQWQKAELSGGNFSLRSEFNALDKRSASEEKYSAP